MGHHGHAFLRAALRGHGRRPWWQDQNCAAVGSRELVPASAAAGSSRDRGCGHAGRAGGDSGHRPGLCPRCGETAACGVGRSTVSSAIAREVVSRLAGRGETLATAESLTGGLIGSLITEVPGASANYVGGAITYATRLKAILAGVPNTVLDADGPVAETTARAMAAAIAAGCDAHRPAGVVRSRRLALAGDRATIRGHTAHQGLQFLADALGEEAAPPVSASTAMSVVD